MPTYLTRNTAAVAVVVVSAKRDVVANNMKLTKEKLQQIIKEELENLVNEEEAIDYAERQKGYEKKIYSMLVAKKIHKDPEAVKAFRADDAEMDYLTMILIKAHDPVNKRDPDYKDKASAAVKRAFDNVIKNIESGEYSKKPDPSTLKFGKTLTPPEYGNLGT